MSVNTGFEELVTAAQLGDARAFAELVERCHHMVHGLVLSTVGEWTTAEDITQDIFLNVWVHLRDLKEPRAFAMWVRRIARNCAVDWLRYQDMRKRRADPSRDAMAAADAASGAEYDDPAAITARRECVDQLCESLQTVSPKLREALILYYLEGHSVAESAESLGIRTDTMKKRLRLGRVELQRKLKRRESADAVRGARTSDDLDQFLPYSPRPCAQRVVAGLAAGPFVPLSNQALSTSKSLLILDHLLHGGSVGALKTAGLTGVLLNWAATGVVAVACLLTGSGFLITHAKSQQDTTASRLPADAGAASGAEFYEGTGHLHSEVWGDPKLGNYLLMEEVFPGCPCDLAGVRAGDRIVKIDGKPLDQELWNTGVQRLKGPAGTKVQVTAMRLQPDGTEKEFNFEVTRGRVSRELFDRQQAQWRAKKAEAPTQGK
jgi:RNA polymerase sigma-70 factor (ECF subfamily)